jgi:hypothetical protein
MRRSVIRILFLVCLIIALSVACAPIRSYRVSPRLHPNLAAAQNYIERAMNRISTAQAVNEFDMNGHAAKAKALLEQAYEEIKRAALAANR